MRSNEKTWSTRRVMLRVGLAGLAAGLAGEAVGQQKIDPKLVMYQETPKGGQECDQCLQFAPPDGCKVVDGKINPKGWCAAFVAKPK